MARGPASPAPNALPKASFVKVTEETSQAAVGVHDSTARTYGCALEASLLLRVWR